MLKLSPFTLILLSVLAVVVLLFISVASIAWFFMEPPKWKTDRNDSMAEIMLLGEAVESYRKDIGSYPPNLLALLVAPADMPSGKSWGGPYLNKKPVDPWGKPYQYSTPGKHNPRGFDIWTDWPDGEEVGNWRRQHSRDK